MVFFFIDKFYREGAVVLINLLFVVWLLKFDFVIVIDYLINCMLNGLKVFLFVF